jgi:phage terminase large subunit-like protein
VTLARDTGQGLERELTPEEIEALAERVRRAKEIKSEIRRRSLENKLEHACDISYSWQRSLCNGLNRTLGLMAANRVGKTWVGALWATIHATGLYPEWWTGVRFTEPTHGWVAGKSIATTRDILQSELLGEDGDEHGTGMIPRDLILGTRKVVGQPDTVELVRIRHISGGVSTITFKSMEQGREKFQGKARHYVWLDEEPKTGDGYDIFSECRTRTMTIPNAQVLVTYTPLLGMNELARYLLEDAKDIHLVNATWEDAPHIDKQTRESLIADMLPHEIEARSLGRPVIAQGLVYPFPEAQITCDPFTVPDNWAHVVGMDLGFTSGTTAILFAKDPKTGVVYIVSEYHKAELDRREHAREIESKWGDGIYIAADPSGNRTESDGKKSIKVYKEDLQLNINLANNSVEIGVGKVYQMLKDGRLKIFKTCRGLLQEIRFYQYGKDGKPMKKRDHHCDACRYGVMALEHAKPLYYFRNKRFKSGVSHARRDQRGIGDKVVGY